MRLVNSWGSVLPFPTSLEYAYSGLTHLGLIEEKGDTYLKNFQRLLASLTMYVIRENPVRV